MVFIRNFSARFPYDSLVLDAQKLEIVTFKGRKVTIDKSTIYFVRGTNGVCTGKGRQPFSQQTVSFVGFCRTYSTPSWGTLCTTHPSGDSSS